MRQSSGGQAPKAPTNASELMAMINHRSELANQLEALSDRSGELVRERGDAVMTRNPEHTAVLDGRIREISSRVDRIQKEKLAIDDMIAKAKLDGIGTESELAPPVPEVPPVPDFPGFPAFPGVVPDGNYVHRNDVREMLAFEGLGFVALGAILWFAMKRSFKRQLAYERALGGKAGGESNAEIKNALDSIAVEVERISENQRFVTALLSERKPAGELLPVDARKPRD